MCFQTFKITYKITTEPINSHSIDLIKLNKKKEKTNCRKKQPIKINNLKVKKLCNRKRSIIIKSYHQIPNSHQKTKK
jgi:hypothetical protein